MHDEELALASSVSGRPPDPTLHDGVPDWLVLPLLDWLRRELRPWSVRQIALRMRIGLGGSEEPAALCDELERRTTTPDGRSDLLDVVGYLVEIDWQELGIPSEFVGLEPVKGTEPLAQLAYLLKTGGSAFRVSKRTRRLERRVDEHTAGFVDRAAAAAGGAAGRHLRCAWQETYGLHPDPTKAYAEAVRAVEAAACPFVLPNSAKPTLGMAIAHLRDASGTWTVAIPGKARDGSPTGVNTLVAMLELLWSGQVSRHAGTTSSRDQLQVEAEAALTLAATLLHWFSIGAVRRMH